MHQGKAVAGQFRNPRRIVLSWNLRQIESASVILGSSYLHLMIRAHQQSTSLNEMKSELSALRKSRPNQLPRVRHRRRRYRPSPGNDHIPTGPTVLDKPVACHPQLSALPSRKFSPICDSPFWYRCKKRRVRCRHSRPDQCGHSTKTLLRDRNST